MHVYLLVSLENKHWNNEYVSYPPENETPEREKIQEAGFILIAVKVVTSKYAQKEPDNVRFHQRSSF